MKEYYWDDKRGTGSLGYAGLLLVDERNDRLLIFRGNDIDGVVAIRHSNFVKDGKWSRTEYKLVLPDHVRAIPFYGRVVSGVARTLRKEFAIVADFANALNVSEREARRFLSEHDERRQQLAALDATAEKLAAVAEASDGDEPQHFRHSFGPFFKRHIHRMDDDVVFLDPEGNEVGRISAEDAYNAKRDKIADGYYLQYYNRGSRTGHGFVEVEALIPKGATVVLRPPLETE